MLSPLCLWHTEGIMDVLCLAKKQAWIGCFMQCMLLWTLKMHKSSAYSNVFPGKESCSVIPNQHKSLDSVLIFIDIRFTKTSVRKHRYV